MKPAAAALIVWAVAAAASAAANIGPVPAFKIPSNPDPKTRNWLVQGDPGNRPYVAPEPVEPEQKVYKCWGYLGRGWAIAEVKSYLVSLTIPSDNTCMGVNTLHDHCWPDMFVIWHFAKLSNINQLRRYCAGRPSSS